MMNFLLALEGIVGAIAGFHSVEAILLKARETPAPRGFNSAFGRGAQVRISRSCV